MDMRIILLFIGSLCAAFAQQANFRSILIERACTKKPDLELCADFMPATTQPSTSIPLLIPPIVTSTNPTTTTSTLAPSPDDSVDFEEFENSTKIGEKDEEKLGSLVRLPKPELTSDEKIVEKVKIEAAEAANSSSIESEKNVMVFVSEYCVIEREHFVKSCNGEIDKNEVTFCKTYPSACLSTNGVIPVISYCQRYYKYYPKHCSKQLVAQSSLQFCFAFEQFCLPELHKAVQISPETPKSSLRKCEDVVDEARKVCNPFPNPKDTFNLLRCTHFLTNCKKYADWLQ